MGEQPDKQNMEVRKLFLYALFLSVLTFFIGVYLGYMLNRYAFQTVYRDYEGVRLSIESLQYLLLEENVCDLEKFNLIMGYLESLGKKIEILQNSNSPFISREDFMLLKAQYFNLEYLHYLLAIKQMRNCNFSYNIILFFYDDSIPCDLCKRQGYQLSLLKAEYEDRLLIYSFDVSYPNTFISYFLQKYSIGGVPSLILISNSTYIFRDFIGYKELENYLTL